MSLYSFGVFAQVSVRGTVTSSDGEPIIGANVIELGSNNGTATDLDGNYQLKVGPNAILEFTYTGYVSQKFTVGVQTVINVTLEEGVSLSELVVTALGISREKKSLTYAAQTIQGGQITQVRDANFVNTLQGKVAGLVVTNASSGVGGATRVILRGNRSIQSSNNALFVVDGVPVDNSTPGQVGNDFGGYNGSDGVANINPDDVLTFSPFVPGQNTGSGSKEKFLAMTGEFKAMVLGAARDYKAATGQKLHVNSALRTQEDQTKLYQAWRNAGGKYANESPAGPVTVNTQYGRLSKPGQRVGNHGGGTAQDSPDNQVAKMRALGLFEKYGLQWIGPSDPPHMQKPKR